MKTSNYILSAFLIFIFGGILFLFIGAKYFDYVTNDNVISEKKALMPFSVVVAESGSNFILKNGPQNSISHSYMKTNVPDKVRYTVHNDTLFVYAVKQQESNKKELSKEGSFTSTSFIFCKKLKSIVAKENAIVYLDKFKSDNLNIHSNRAKVRSICNKNATVFVQAKDSDINFSGGYIDNLNVKLDHTKLSVALKKRTLRLSATLKNNTQAAFSMCNSIDLTVDPTSNYDFVNTIK